MGTYTPFCAFTSISLPIPLLPSADVDAFPDRHCPRRSTAIASSTYSLAFPGTEVW